MLYAQTALSDPLLATFQRRLFLYYCTLRFRFTFLVHFQINLCMRSEVATEVPVRRPCTSSRRHSNPTPSSQIILSSARSQPPKNPSIPRPSIYPLLKPKYPLFGTIYPYLRVQGGSWLYLDPRSPNPKPCRSSEPRARQDFPTPCSNAHGMLHKALLLMI